jgi:hypothetical protein
VLYAVPSEARDYFSVGTGRTEAQGGFNDISNKNTQKFEAVLEVWV